MKLLVLGGGEEPERAVSLRSAAWVAEHARTLGHEVIELDPHGLGRDELLAVMRDVDVVLPILHGVGGEDGSLQEHLETAGTPFLGSDAAASRRCFDKIALKEHLGRHGLPFSPGHLVDSLSFYHSPHTRRPFVLKPVASGSSIDTHIVRRPLELPPALHHSLLHYDFMLLEELVEGVEITVPVLGDEVLPVIEILPPEGEEFDYENKYNGKTSELCPAVSISLEMQEAAQRLALQAHRLAGCRHLSRTDMIVRPDGSIILLEVNTMPGMTAESLLPKAAAVAGYDGAQLVKHFITLTLS